MCLPKSASDIDSFFKVKDESLKDSHSILKYIEYHDFEKTFNKEEFLLQNPQFKPTFDAIQTIVDEPLNKVTDNKDTFAMREIFGSFPLAEIAYYLL